ncbi:MAG: PspC domain-containing protein [Candidatus Nealsonbacteria bacterium]|nr:PspC domain-containing protein [Candidatus Nealsonbacteria bacterium]
MEQNKKPIRQLYRSGNNRIIFGVCGGLGEYFEIDPIIFRIIFLALTFSGAGSGLFIYILLSILIPKERPTSSDNPEDVANNIDLRKRADGLISELRDGRLSKSRNNWLGWIIVIFGSILLLDQILPKDFFNWNLFWAVVIIIVGFFILTRGGSEEKNIPKEESPSKEEYKEEHYKSNLNIGRLFFGLLFLVIGFAFLIKNFGWIPGVYVGIGYLFKFWPVFIIICGLSFLSRGSRIGAILSVVFVVIVIILLAVSLFFPNPNWFLEIWNLVSR